MSGLEIGIAITVSSGISFTATRVKIFYTPDEEEYPYSVGCNKTRLIEVVGPLRGIPLKSQKNN